MITFIALTTAHRALEEGIIGYQSEIREAYENLCAYLQDKFPAIDLAAVFAQPDNPAIKENFVAQIEQRVGKFEPTLQEKTSKVIEAIGYIMYGGNEVSFDPYIPEKIEHPMQILAAYGLDELLTDEDDPMLWATIVADAWGVPRKYEDPIHEYFFDISSPLPDSDKRQVASWRLYEADSRIRPYPWTEADRYREMIHYSGKLEPASRTITVERPSATVDTASVGHGFIVLGGLGGSGRWGEWVRRADGSWVPDRRGGSWIS